MKLALITLATLLCAGTAMADIHSDRQQARNHAKALRQTYKAHLKQPIDAIRRQLQRDFGAVFRTNGHGNRATYWRMRKYNSNFCIQGNFTVNNGVLQSFSTMPVSPGRGPAGTPGAQCAKLLGR